MRTFSLVKPDETEQKDTGEVVSNNKQRYFPESAEMRQKAIHLGTTILAILVYGGLCAKFGLALATLIAAGVSCVSIPIVIYALRNRHIWLPFYNEKILGAKLPEIVPEFETDYQFIVMKNKLQLVAANQFPRFFNLQFVRVIYKEVPNGIMYDVTKHYWSTKNEFIELTLSNKEPLAKAWDKKFRAALLKNAQLQTEVELHYQE
jgi:hypothetical protein